jgi:hypothetical protein
MNIIDATPTCRAFGGLKPLKKLETGANWTVPLKAILALPMDEQVPTPPTRSKSAESSSEREKSGME